MNKKIAHKSNQVGAVSLFVVVFAALLMTVVTVGFIQLMVKDQQQATASDLSQSAYDSAQAGVEDAKRLLLALQACGESADIKCEQYRTAVSSGACSTLSDASIVANTGGETLIEQGGSDDAMLDQAYTCVTIDPNPTAYRRPLLRNQSLIVPLRAVGEFNRVEINWFTRSDAGGNTAALESADTVLLPPVDNKWWASSAPPILRTQLIQTGESFQLNDFEDAAGASTLFLYPRATGSETGDFALNARRSPTTAPTPVKCRPNFNTSNYACSMTLALPAPKNGSLMNRGANLRLSSLYNDTQIELKLLNTAGEYVKFDSVQAEVDSTGRANDLFRRVKARVELTASMPYPEAAVDIAGNLCKEFFVTDDPAEYESSCTP